MHRVLTRWAGTRLAHVQSPPFVIKSCTCLRWAHKRSIPSRTTIQVLRWNLCPVLAPDWLSLYLQSLFSNPSMISTPSASAAFNLPGNVGSEVNERKFPRETFVNIMQLIDVCLLDVESLRSVIDKLTISFGIPFQIPDRLVNCSCSLSFLMSKSGVDSLRLQVSERKSPHKLCNIIYPPFLHSRDQLNVCVRWMTRFAEALAQEGLKPMKRLPGKVNVETCLASSEGWFVFVSSTVSLKLMIVSLCSYAQVVTGDPSFDCELYKCFHITRFNTNQHDYLW